MTEIRHLQLVILQIIKDIDTVCRNNGITYYLYGGSAIGAVRHQGFIPWDDDLDIIMTHDNYARFLAVAREQLPRGKYFVQEGRRDWPLAYSKVKLIGTHVREAEGFAKDATQDGIFVDIFKMDNTSSRKTAQLWQYVCAKYYLCYLMNKRSYKTASWQKKMLMAASFPLKNATLRRFFVGQAERYNKLGDTTTFVGSFYEPKRFHTCIFPRRVFGTPKIVPFEDTMLPIPEDCDAYLRQVFGEYMQLPPVEERQWKHLQQIDFGTY